MSNIKAFKALPKAKITQEIADIRQIPMTKILCEERGIKYSVEFEIKDR